jgi:hypothetical protein
MSITTPVYGPRLEKQNAKCMDSKAQFICSDIGY